MCDIDALLAAGFVKTLSEEEWEQMNARLPEVYNTGDNPNPSNVTINYILERGDVRLVTEQNTQEQAPLGVQTTVRYPEIVVLESTRIPNLRVSVDATNTELILAVADDIQNAGRGTGSPNVRRNG